MVILKWKVTVTKKVNMDLFLGIFPRKIYEPKSIFIYLEDDYKETFIDFMFINFPPYLPRIRDTCLKGHDKPR